jgi:putative spermidine/putrescine transport system substrate-binding protein
MSGVARAADQLTIVSWGGAYSKSQDMAYDEPFTKKFGINVVHEDKAANGLAGIRAQEQSGNVTWDVVDMIEGPALRACDEGIIEPIAYDKILAPAPDGTLPTKDFIQGTLSGCFIPEIVYATLFAYNEDAFPNEKPKTIKDVFDLKKFPGKRSLQKIPAGNLEWALVADGVPIDKVYDVLSTDEGVERAFAKLDTIKDHVVWWSEGAQPPQLLADKEVVIATGYNGRFYNAAVNEHQPIKIIWDGQLFELDGWVVPKGKLTENVKKYLHFATDTQRLADQAKYISYGPARNSSNALVPASMQPHMPTNPSNFETPIKKNAEWWADNGDSMSERFNAWLAR